MPQFENRDEWEARLKRDLVDLTGPQADKLIRLLGNPPNIDNVPESFWRELGDAEAEVLQPALTSVYVESAQQTDASVPKVLRVDWHLINEPAAAWAERYTFDLVSQIDTTSRERLQNYVSGFFRNEGTNVGDLREQISGLFGPVRADLIATTEVTRAAAQGDIGIIKEIEQANPKIQMVPFWDTSMDEWVCPVCGGQGLQGVQGQMVAGQPRFKSRNGKTYGPPPDPHPRCRCGMRWEPSPARKGAGASKPVAPVEPPAPPLPTEAPPLQPEPQPVATAPAPAVPGKPTGKPVSEALKLPKSKYGKIYRKVIDLINSVHGDGNLTPIPVETRNLGEGYLGVFRRNMNNQPEDIGVNPKGNHIESTLAHEIGHYLDNFLGSQLRGAAFASEVAGKGGDSPLTKWWEAVQDSSAYKTLIDMMQNPTDYRLEGIYYSPDGTQQKFYKAPDVRYLSYLTTPREFFARSYAQYIAERTGDTTMIEQIASERKHEMYHDTQWLPDDFEAVASAMDAALLEIGWTQ